MRTTLPSLLGFVAGAMFAVPSRGDPEECAMRYDGSGVCALGACDSAAERDAWIGDQSGAAKLKLRMKVHVLDPAILILPDPAAWTVAATDRAVDDMKLRNIQLDYAYTIYDDDGFGESEDGDELEAMIQQYIETPYVQLNVFVADTSAPALNFNGKAEPPWDAPAGVVVVDGGVFHPNYSTLTHEIGHALGLWHTYHGTKRGELDQHGGECGDLQNGPCGCRCYEGTSYDGDVVGDFCSDTPPAPQDNFCSNPSPATHPCEGEQWGSTDYRNFMSGAQGSCRNHFTAQQTRRMHCWTCDAHSLWIESAEGACCIDNECSILLESCCLNRGGYFAGPDTVCGNDCNENQIADVCEFDTGGCCTGSTCAVMAESCCDDISGSFGGHLSNCGDCNENSTPDACDIASSASDDCNENGAPDDCEIADNPLADCNDNDILDECESLAVRACCFQDETCQDLTQCACNALDGAWALLNRLCAQTQCAHYVPQP